ncbi:hypothetical protein ABPG73_001357 [Tetrahymena malaccensis]
MEATIRRSVQQLLENIGQYMSMSLIIKLILSISIPILLGVLFNLSIFYFILFQNVDQWEQQQTQQVIINEKQKLHNLVFGFKTTIEISFNTIEQDLIKFHNFYSKMINNKVLVRKQFSYIPCSYRNYAFNNCTQLFQQEFKKGNTFVEGFFHRTTFEFNEFTFEKKQRLKNIWDSYILAKSTYIARTKSLIAISDVFQAYDDSLLTTTPMLDMNLTAFSPYQTCITNQTFLENYDPRCRGWYKNTVSQAGKYQIYQYKPYKDAFTNTITMSGTTLVLDEKTDAFLGIIGMDFQIASLITNILSSLDEMDESQITSGYSLIFHENNNTIFHHKYWQNTDDVEYSWQDIEYNSTTFYSAQEKNSFVQQVSKAKNLAQSFDYNIEKQINTDQFYISFSKNNQSYYSLVYPINSLQSWQVFSNTSQNRIILYVGRVQRDLRYILQSYNVFKDRIFLLVMISEIAFIILLILVFNMHLAAVLYYQLQIPIESLIIFLNKRIQQSKKKIITMTKQKSQLQNKSNHSLTQKQTSQFKFQQSSYIVDKTIPQAALEQINTYKFSPQNRYQSQEFLLRQSDSLYKATKMNPQEISQNESQFNRYFSISENKQQSNSENLTSVSETQINNNGSFYQILDYEPIFQEIQIISQTFHHLQAVINYKSTLIDTNANFTNSILHFAKARKTFQMINNTYGQIISLANVGYFQLLQDFNEQKIIKQEKYNYVIESFDFALQFSLYEIGLSNFNEFKTKFQEGLIKIHDHQDYLILNSINLITILKCKLMKVTAFNMADNYIFKNQKKENENLNSALYQKKYIQLLQQAIQLLQFTETVIIKLRKYSEIDSNSIEQDLIVLKLDILEMQIMLSSQSSVDQSLIAVFGDQHSYILENMLKINEVVNFKNAFLLNESKYEDSNILEPQNRVLKSSCYKESNLKLTYYSQTTNYYVSRVTYLKALILFKQNQFYQSSQLLTSIIEDNYFLDQQIKYNSFKILNQIFIQNNLPNKYLEKQLNKFYHSQSYDLIFFIEASEYEILPGCQLVSFLNELKQKFISKNDRVSFNIFNNEEQINLLPLIQIQEQKQWEISIHTLIAQLNNLCFSYYDQQQNNYDKQNDQLANQIVAQALNQIIQANLINIVPDLIKNKKLGQNFQKSNNTQQNINRQAYTFIFSANQNSSINKLLNKQDALNNIAQKLLKFPQKIQLLNTISQYNLNKANVDLSFQSSQPINTIYKNFKQFTSLNQLKSYLFIKKFSK